ncbi:MAG: SDR family NAD(P)-dependent oxidoreductase [Anaerolineae bacterium]|nr:SDR family NAD(P)-dependent oxidoreductase [Anaerolineae bacterium]
MSIKDSIIIVTGASKGIGRATALAFAREGAHVLAVARSSSLLDELAVQASTLPAEIVAAPADVTQCEQVEAVVSLALTRYGRIDVLVNNAGVELVKPVETFTDDDYAAMLDTNLKGIFLFTRAVVPSMKAQRSGLVINIASTAGLRGFAGDALYCASKFGVVGLTEALDEELRKFGIRVSCISPGATNTELAKDTWSPPDDPYRPHFLQPEDVARAILYVASQPPHVTVGQILLLPTVEPRYSPLLPLGEE